MAFVIDDAAFQAFASFFTLILTLIAKAWDAVVSYVEFLHNNFPWNQPTRLLVLFLMYMGVLILLLGFFGGMGIRGSAVDDEPEPISIGSGLVRNRVGVNGSFTPDGGVSPALPSVATTTSTLPSTINQTETLPYLPDLGNYTFPVTCFDDLENGDEDGVDCGGGCWPCHCSNGIYEPLTEDFTDCGYECAVCSCIDDGNCPSGLCADVGDSSRRCYNRCIKGGPYPPYPILGSRALTLDWFCTFQSAHMFSEINPGSDYWTEYTGIATDF